jgi:hypothetical protein
MSDSLWVQLSKAISDRLTGASVAQLRQMHTAMASSRSVIRAYRPSVVRPPWRSRSSWPLRVSLADSIHCRIQPMDRAGAPGPCGRGGPGLWPVTGRRLPLTTQREKQGYGKFACTIPAAVPRPPSTVSAETNGPEVELLRICTETVKFWHCVSAKVSDFAIGSRYRYAERLARLALRRW